MSVTIRWATEEDAGPFLDIYAPIVRDTPISFEVEPPTPEEMRRRIADTLVSLPWLVCERDGQLLGYAYASRHRARAAYQWCVDVSAYVAAGARRAGVARALYRALFGVLALQGYYNAYAGIALPNPASVGLHEALGFRPVGVYEAVGHKLGAWHDVGWWQLTLQPRGSDPESPRRLNEVWKTPACTAILHEAACQVRLGEPGHRV
jgi:phosphinothricin acetyltransferase